ASSTLRDCSRMMSRQISFRRGSAMMSAAIAVVLYFFHTTGALACADGFACAVIKQTQDGFVALRSESLATSTEVGRLNPYEIVVIFVGTCRPNDPWTRVECIPRIDGFCNEKSKHETKRYTTGWVNTKLLVPAQCPLNVN